jgi:hypothetical protein
MADLARAARRDVWFAHLWDRPQAYRGVPVHLLGTAMEVQRVDSKHARNGWLYMVWMVTEDSHPNPFVCVVEEPPPGFPIGVNVNERVVFNGYFLKLYEYTAHKNIARAAPLLIGRLGWTPPPGGVKGKGESPKPILWLMVGVGVMFAISFFRWMTGLRRSLSNRRSTGPWRDRPTEEIAPDALASYLNSVGTAEEGEPVDEEPGPP